MDKIQFIVEKERLPFSNSDKISIGIILTIIISIGVFAISHFATLWATVGILLGVLFFSVIIYTGYSSTLMLHPIQTDFNLEQNKKIVMMCLNHLNIKAFSDKNNTNVFVCFVHDRNALSRQEIYLIAKENKVLLYSNKEKDDADGPRKNEWIDKIGMCIFATAKHIKALDNKPVTNV